MYDVIMDDQGSISPMFYEQLLHLQIPKVQKKLLDLTVFFALLVSACIKAARRTLMKLNPVKEDGFVKYVHNKS